LNGTDLPFKMKVAPDMTDSFVDGLYSRGFTAC